MGRNPAPLTDHWTFWKVLWLSNAGSGKHFDSGQRYQDLLFCPQGLWKWRHRGPPPQINQMPRSSSRWGELPLGCFLCNNLEKSICYSLEDHFYDAVEVVSSFLDTWPGNWRDKRPGHLPKTGSGSTSSLDAHCLHVLEFILHQKLLSPALAKLRSMCSFS